MKRMRFVVAMTVGLLALAACTPTSSSPAGSAGAGGSISNLTINAPAAPGSGFDQTARAIQATLQGEGIIESVTVTNDNPGSGGTIALAQFVNEESGNEELAMVLSFVALGAQNLGETEVKVQDSTLIARLFSESNVIVVPNDSPFQSIGDLVAAMQEDPASVALGGGSAGGPDHLIFAAIAQASGIETADINYAPYEGGSEVAVAILGNQLAAGTSGYAELAGQIDAGEMRALAVTGEEPLEGVDIPTLTEEGIDVAQVNWRFLVAPPGLSDEHVAALTDAIVTMHDTDAWRDILATNSWTDFFATGDELTQYVESEDERVRVLLESLGLVGSQ